MKLFKIKTGTENPTFHLLVRFLIDEVAWRVVVADPYLLVTALGHTTSDLSCLFPDDLGVVTTLATLALARLVMIEFLFTRPIVDHVLVDAFHSFRAIDIFTVLGVRRMCAVAVFPCLLVGPCLGDFGKLIRPFYWRRANFLAPEVMPLNHPLHFGGFTIQM